MTRTPPHEVVAIVPLRTNEGRFVPAGTTVLIHEEDPRPSGWPEPVLFEVGLEDQELVGGMRWETGSASRASLAPTLPAERTTTERNHAMRQLLSDLLSSKKFVAACAAGVAVLAVRVAGKAGVVLDQETATWVGDRFVALALAYLAGQGLADHGKTKAQVEANGHAKTKP